MTDQPAATTNLTLICGGPPEPDMALMWVAPDTVLFPDGDATAALPPAFRDAGLVIIDGIDAGTFADDGTFTVRCLESNRIVLGLSWVGGRHNVVLDAVDGAARIRYYLPGVAFTPAEDAQSGPIPGEPMTWTLTATADPATIVRVVDQPELV